MLDKAVVDIVNAVMLPGSNASLNAFRNNEISLTGLTGAQAVQLRSEGETLLSYDDASETSREVQIISGDLDLEEEAAP